MIDLRTSYLGLELEHPIVASPSPLARTLDGIRQLEDAGAAAVVLPSIYEEEVEAEDAAYVALVEQGSGSHPEAEGYFTPRYADASGLDARLEVLRKAATACGVPILASLNGASPSGWVRIARDVESAGAAAIELNLYGIPANLEESSQAIEERLLATVQAVVAAVRIPVAVKLGPWLSAPGHFCQQLVQRGARGVVLFNRFYQPDTDLESLRVVSRLELSHPHEMRQALLWISLLAGRLPASLAATTGVETSEQVIKYLLAGADVVMTTSALLRHGPIHLRALRRGLEAWMQTRSFPSVQALRGRLSLHASAPEQLLRAQYMEMLLTYPRATVLDRRP